MPSCENCKSHVTSQYARVFGLGENEVVEVCPNCEDKVRGGGGRARKSRSMGH